MDCADYLSYIFFKVLCDFYPFGSEWFSHIKLHIRDAVSRYKLLARFTSFYECKSLNFFISNKSCNSTISHLTDTTS